MSWPIWALCRNREILFLPLWDWHPVQPINGRRCCGCRRMAIIEVQLVGLSTKRRRRGEPGFRDAAWATGGRSVMAGLGVRLGRIERKFPTAGIGAEDG